MTRWLCMRCWNEEDCLSVHRFVCKSRPCIGLVCVSVPHPLPTRIVFDVPHEQQQQRTLAFATWW